MRRQPCVQCVGGLSPPLIRGYVLLTLSQCRRGDESRRKTTSWRTIMANGTRFLPAILPNGANFQSTLGCVDLSDSARIARPTTAAASAHFLSRRPLRAIPLTRPSHRAADASSHILRLLVFIPIIAKMEQRVVKMIILAMPAARYKSRATGCGRGPD